MRHGYTFEVTGKDGVTEATETGIIAHMLIAMDEKQDDIAFRFGKITTVTKPAPGSAVWEVGFFGDDTKLYDNPLEAAKAIYNGKHEK
jgi:hypothetical protein